MLASQKQFASSEKINTAYGPHFIIGCDAGLEAAFKCMIDEARSSRPELPTIVFSGFSGAGKTVTAAALSRYLKLKGIDHQLVATDMFISRDIFKIIQFAGLLGGANLVRTLVKTKLPCAIGIKSLEVLHEFEGLSDLLEALSTMSLPRTIRPVVRGYKVQELLPKRLTIIEGSCASIMASGISNLQHCFIEEELSICKQRFIARDSGKNGEHRLRASVTSLFLHSPAAVDTILTQNPVSDFRLRIDSQYNVKNAFLDL